MDHKSTWLWRKKSTEKMIVSSDKINNISPKENEDEILALLTDKAELEKDLKSLNDKLSHAQSECNTKDDLVKKQAKMTEEAMTGWQKAESKASSLKQGLDEALQQRAAGEERLAQMESALKECMQQLRFVREEKEHRIHDAVMKASGEFEKSQMILEEKLAETSKKLGKVVAENTQLSKALLAKGKLIEDLNKQKAQVEADLGALVIRLESTEKDDASLKYEVRLLEKELEIRNEEREFNRRSADVSHKQHLESVKKIAKLESECQRLRLLVRKRLPGPAALAKMKNEVDILGRDSVEMRRRRTNSNPNGLIFDSTVDSSGETLNKHDNFLTEQLCAIEEENKTLKDTLNKKVTELQTSRAMYVRAASKLSQADLQFDELPNRQASLEPPSKTGLPTHDLSLASMSDAGSDDKISCAESWASALISELEQFKQGKQRGPLSGKTVGASDMNLMDDFVEMERLAIVSVDQQSGSPHVPFDEHSSQVTSREIIPLVESSSGVTNQEIKKDASCGLNDDDVMLTDKANQQIQSDLGKSIQRIVEHVEGMTSPNYGTSEDLSRKDGNFFPYKNETASGYTVRVFQWKSSELNAVLQQFVQACYDLLNGKSDISRFAEELSSALEWVVNHCFSLQDVSSMKDAIKKQFEWDETRSEGEADAGLVSQSSEVDKSCLSREQSPFLSAKNGLPDGFEREDMERRLHESEETIASLQKELESLKMSKAITENQNENQRLTRENLLTQITMSKAELKEAQQKISTMEVELGNRNTSCQEPEATCVELQLQLESAMKKEIPEEEKQLRTDQEITAASEKLAECQETILNLGKQLKALAAPNEAGLFDKVISNSPDKNGDLVGGNATFSFPKNKLMNQRSSLLDQMVAEDDAKTKDAAGSHKIIQSDNISSAFGPDKAIEPRDKILILNGSTKNRDDNIAITSLAIVPSKKKGGGNLWKKLLWRKKRSNSKKPTFPFAP